MPSPDHLSTHPTHSDAWPSPLHLPRSASALPAEPDSCAVAELLVADRVAAYWLFCWGAGSGILPKRGRLGPPAAPDLLSRLRPELSSGVVCLCLHGFEGCTDDRVSLVVELADHLFQQVLQRHDAERQLIVALHNGQL
jgi:hypothetical protein